MSELTRFKRNAVVLGLCDEYKERWDACEKKEELASLALDANGVSMLCDAMAFGWGPSPEYVKTNFKPFLNGRWVLHRNGYSSSLYVDLKGEIWQSTTITTVVSSACVIHVPETHVCKIYISGKSNVQILCDGLAFAFVYGENKVSYDGNVHLHHVSHSEWTGKT